MNSIEFQYMQYLYIELLFISTAVTRFVNVKFRHSHGNSYSSFINWLTATQNTT